MSTAQNNRVLILLVAFLLLSNIFLLLYFLAWKKQSKPDRPARRPMIEYIQKELGFNDSQTVQFQRLRDQHKEEIKPLFEDIRKAKDSLYSLLRSKAASDSMVMDAIKNVGSRQEALEFQIFRHFQKVRALCDKDQEVKFDSLMSRMINRPPWFPGKSRSDSEKVRK